MGKIEDMLAAEGVDLQHSFDRMNIVREDFDKFHANMAVAAKANPAQGAVNRALYATMAGMKAKGGERGGELSGAAEVERLMKEADMSFYINVNRATANITATNSIGLYVAGKPVILPYVLFGLNDQGSNYSASLKNVLGNLQIACPGIKYAITQTGGTQVWTWTYGVQVDVVTISYGGYNTNYLNLLNNQNQLKNTFYSRYTNYVISDAINGGYQGLQADIQWINVSNGGSQQANELLPNAIKNSYEFLEDRWNLKYPEQHYDANLAIVDTIIPCPATDIANGISFTVQHNIFARKHESHPSKQGR